MKIENIKQYFIELKNLMLPFKWYIVAYMFVLSGPIHEYFFPPEANDPIWGSVVMYDSWNYANQEIYVESMKILILINFLVLLIATSNMRNHPKIAKLVFLSPWLFGLWHLLMVLLGVEDY